MLIVLIIAPIAIVIAICVAIVRNADIKKENVKSENDINEPNKSNGKGWIMAIGAIILGITIAIGITYFSKQNDNSNDESTPRLLSRSATLNDITITGDDFDISSFGERLTFNPKKDIDGLNLKFVFQKSNGTQIQTIEKSMGNVKEGQQYSITISIVDLSWEVMKNVGDIQCKYTVSAGTISYFA